MYIEKNLREHGVYEQYFLETLLQKSRQIYLRPLHGCILEHNNMFIFSTENTLPIFYFDDIIKFFFQEFCI